MSKKQIENIINRQHDFQKFVGFPIDSNLEKDRNEMSEKYVFKMIEEAIELRKEFPSVMNPWSKKQKNANFDRIKEELSDVILFYFNILITWKISFNELLEMVEMVQENNFNKVKEKKMKILDEKLLNLPGYDVILGFGKLNPKNIFVYQDSPKDTKRFTVGSHIDKICEKKYKRGNYTTRIIKTKLKKNKIITDEEINFWLPFFIEEIEILKANNKDCQIVPLDYPTMEILQSNKIDFIPFENFYKK